jgi:hypothetical protein
MESCKPMASRPASRCSRISGWLQRAEDKGAQGARSPNFPKWALEYLRLRCTAAQRQNGCVGQSQQWTRLPTAFFPVMGPQTTPTSAGPCFLQDSMHGDSYPCCRQSIRLCLPAYSSKALTDIKIAGELLRALSRWWSSSRRSRSQIGWLQVSSQFALTGGMSAVLVWVSTAPGRVTLLCNRSRR